MDIYQKKIKEIRQKIQKEDDAKIQIILDQFKKLNCNGQILPKRPIDMEIVMPIKKLKKIQ